MTHEKIQLKNDFLTVMMPNPSMHLVYLTFFIRAGSRYENKDTNGLAHLLEHLFVREMKDKLKSIGAKVHAETVKEFSFYEIIILPEYLKEVLETLAAVFQKPDFKKESLETEKRIILEECMLFKNSKGEDIDLDELSAKLLWGDSSLALKIQGETDRIKNFSIFDIENYQKSFFTANNTLLCVIGAFSAQTMRSLTKKYFLSWSSGSQKKITKLNSELVREGGAHYSFIRNESSQANVRLAFYSPSYGDKNFVSSEILNAILNQRLKEVIRAQKGLVYNIDSRLSPMSLFSDVGTLNIDFKASSKNVLIVVKEIIALIEQRFTKEELDMAKIVYKRDLMADFDNPRILARMVSLNLLLHYMTNPDNKVKQAGKTTLKLVNGLASRISSHNNLNLVVVGHYSLKQETQIRELLRN